MSSFGSLASTAGDGIVTAVGMKTLDISNLKLPQAWRVA